jgi:uncharacterized protein YeeX (DUF496 family)
MSVEGVVEEVKQEVVKVAAEVKAEVEKVVEAVKPEVKKLVQELTAEEKLALREIENAYLKAQMEIQRIQPIIQKAQQDFTKTVEGLVTKYAVDPAEWAFDNVKLIFTKKPAAPAQK